MIKIRRLNKRSQVVLLGSFIIAIGIIIPFSKYSYYHHLDNENNDMINIFFEDNNITLDNDFIDDNINKEENIVYQSDYDYIAVLEIPSISLKRGLFDKSSSYNTISKNIQILDESDMPNVDNGNLILASHSGNSHISFFKNLEKINIDDLVNIYYENIKYVYKVVNIYEEVKDGDITIHRNNNKTTLTLTTCSQNHKGNQLIVICELIDKNIF